MTNSQPLKALDRLPELRNDVHVVLINWFVNRCPLVSRLPRLPIGCGLFSLINRPAPGADGTPGQPSASTQYCEIFSEAARPSRQAAAPELLQAPFEQGRMDALQQMADTMEVSCYYGRGEAPGLYGRPKQKGLKTILVTNHTTEPQNADAYKPSDLVRDTLERCRQHGGDPDVLLVSTNFMIGFSVWGHPALRIDAGVNIFGTPIDIYESPILGGVSIIEAPLLKSGTAICLTSSELRWRMRRNEFWQANNEPSVALTGAFAAEGAIEVDNEAHHAWVEGIRAFRAEETSSS